MTKNVHDPAQSKIININYVQNTLGTRRYTHKTGARSIYMKKRERMTYDET